MACYNNGVAWSAFAFVTTSGCRLGNKQGLRFPVGRTHLKQLGVTLHFPNKKNLPLLQCDFSKFFDHLLLHHCGRAVQLLSATTSRAASAAERPGSEVMFFYFSLCISVTES